MSQQEDDLVCLRRMGGGDSRALAELYDRYGTLVYSVALRILRSSADAEDAVQQAWVQVWKSAPSYDSKRGSVAAWIITIGRSRALDLYRSLGSRRRAETHDDAAPTATPEDPVTGAALGQLGARVRDALGALAPQQRQVLEIAYFEGLSQSQIAERLKAPLGTVKSWTRQGLTRLKELLQKEEWA
jgi:RNA polymerase sigma-70 factor (ECF subfamily)